MIPYPPFPLANRRNAIVFVRGEKEVLLSFVQLAEAAIPLLEMQWSEAKRIIQKDHSTPRGRNPVNDYINAIVVTLLKKKPQPAA
jgi:hypothetical protein